MQPIRVSSKLGFSEGILSPAEILDALVAASVAKAEARAGSTLALGVLGGVFIAFAGAFFTAALVGAAPGVGTARLVGGIAFSLGLILVVVAGAELFTGNALMLLAYWRKRLTGRALLRNWGLVLAGNAIGAVGVAALIAASGLLSGPHGALAQGFATARFELAPEAAFVRGVLCNSLVCLAVWMSYSSRTPAGKIVCIVAPVAGFVTIGLEHSIANLYLLPVGLMAGAPGGIGNVLANFAPVAAGNLVGAALVAWLYANALQPAAEPAAEPATSPALTKSTAASRVPAPRAAVLRTAGPEAARVRVGADA